MTQLIVTVTTVIVAGLNVFVFMFYYVCKIRHYNRGCTKSAYTICHYGLQSVNTQTFLILLSCGLIFWPIYWYKLVFKILKISCFLCSQKPLMHKSAVFQIFSKDKMNINTTSSFQCLLSFWSTNTVILDIFIFVRHSFVQIKHWSYLQQMFGRSTHIFTPPPSRNDHPMIGPLLKIYKTLDSFQSPSSLSEMAKSTI